VDILPHIVNQSFQDYCVAVSTLNEKYKIEICLRIADIQCDMKGCIDKFINNDFNQ